MTLQLAFTYAPFMATVFETEPVTLAHGVLIVAIGVALLLLLEAEKWIRRGLIRAQAPRPESDAAVKLGKCHA